LVIYFSAAPEIKTESGTSNRWGTTNSKSLGAIIMMSQSETLSSNQIVFITLLAESVAAPSTSHHKVYSYHEPKPIFLIQTGIFQAYFIFFFIQFYSSRSHNVIDKP
jgi:hypothetical protein